MRIRECEVVYRVRTIDGPQIKRIASSEDVYRMLGPIGANRAAESLWVILLDIRHTVIGLHEVARGGVSSAPVAAADVFRAAIVAGAAAIVLAHNHPSGDCTPSAEDIDCTRKLVDAGKLLGVAVLDHVVISIDGYSSLLDLGHMGR